MKLVIVESPHLCIGVGMNLPTKVPPQIVLGGEGPRFCNQIKDSDKIGTKTIS